MAVGIWTLAEKSDYISLLQSNIYLATAYILVVAGAVVMITGILGCCATFREQRSLLKVVSVSFLNGLQLEPRMRRGTWLVRRRQAKLEKKPRFGAVKKNPLLFLSYLF